MTPLALTVVEAAKAASIGRSKVFKEIREGRLKAVKVGRSTRVRIADLQQWLDSRPAIAPRIGGEAEARAQRRRRHR